MKNYSYIIIGGGMTAGSAISGIREIDKSGPILAISKENALPYNRPPLSKKLWMGGEEQNIYLDFDENNVDFQLNTQVLSINPELKRVVVSSGDVFSYEKLLLATGGSVKQLPFGRDDLIHYYRTIEDYHTLKSLTKQKRNFAVIGAGFIGSEIAAALAKNGMQVTLIEAGPGIGWKVFSEDMVQFLNGYYREKGVNILVGVNIESLERTEHGIEMKFEKSDSLMVDAVIAGVGIMPNVELAQDCELAVQDGIQVNEILQTSEPSIFSAGDVANFYNPLLDRRIRVEHADNAQVMGKTAGRNMADANEPYTYLPLFYSDMFDLGYEAVGILDSRLETFADWQEKYHKGVVYYLEDEKVVGVLLWNVWGKTDAAREVIGSKKTFSGDDLKGLIV